jgi:hypothetical protein
VKIELEQRNHIFGENVNKKNKSQFYHKEYLGFTKSFCKRKKQIQNIRHSISYQVKRETALELSGVHLNFGFNLALKSQL